MQEMEIQELFARLTALFEDAAALATEGQTARLLPELAVRLVQDIATIVAASERDLIEVERRLKS